MPLVEGDRRHEHFLLEHRGRGDAAAERANDARLGVLAEEPEVHAASSITRYGCYPQVRRVSDHNGVFGEQSVGGTREHVAR